MKNKLIRFKKTSKGRVTVVRCHNLRPDNRSLLVPVDPPATVSTIVKRPLAFTTTSDSQCHAIVETHDGRIAHIPGVSPSKPMSLALPARPLFTPSSSVHGALAANDEVTLFTDNGPVTLFYSPEESTPWLISENMPRIPGITLSTIDTVQVESVAAGCELAGTYSQQNRHLSQSDASRVDKMLSDAYIVLADRARAADMFIQPVMAAYRLYDRAGKEIYRSAPVLLQSSAGSQPGGTMVMNIVGNTLAGCTLSAQGFRIVMNITSSLPAKWASLIDRAVVVVSPQIHPFDPQRPAFHSIAYSGGSLTLHSSLRGYNSGISASDRSTSQNLLSRLIASFNDVSVPFHTLRNPFAEASATASPHSIVKSSPMQIMAEVAAVRSLSFPKISAVSPEMSYAVCSATSVCRSGASMFYANPSFATFPGFNPADHAVATDNPRSWQAFVKVTFGDGSEIAVNSAQGDAAAPVALSPIVMYPSSRAVSLTFTVKTSADVRSATIPLSPIEQSGIAVGFTSDFKPLTLQPVQGAQYAVPAAISKKHTLHGYVAAGNASTPGAFATITRVSNHTVAAVVPAPSPSGAWDYGRSRAYAFSAEGCSLVVAEKKCSSITSGLVMPGCLPDPALVAPAKDCVYVALPSENAIYTIAGRRVREVARIPASGSESIAALMRDGVRGELWCIPSAPNATSTSKVEATVVSLANPEEGYTASVSPVIGVFRDVDGCESLAWLASGSLSDFSSSMPADNIECCWQAVVTHDPALPEPVSGVIIHASGSPSQCIIEITRSNISGHTPRTTKLLSASLTGILLGPVTLPIFSAPSAAPTTVTLSANASSDDFTLSSIILT